MLYIQWVNDKMGHPHAVWNATKMPGDMVSGEHLNRISGSSTPGSLTGRSVSGQVSIQRMPKARLHRFWKN